MVYDAYNLTIVGNNTGIVGLMQSVNTNLMFGMFGIMLITTIFLITLLSFVFATDKNFGKSLSASTFICFVLSLFLMILDLVPNYIVFLFLIGFAGSIVFAKND